MAKAVQKKTVAPPQDEVEFFPNVVQRSEDWFACRRGLLTASKFSVMIASGKDGGDSVGRATLMRRLAGEILSGHTAETFRNESMDRGNEMEPAARAYYERTRFADLQPMGFVKRTVRTPLGQDFIVGCSPDSQVGADGGLEIKTMRPDLLIEVLQKGAGGFPSTHRAQCQGTCWVTGWKWVDLLMFYDGMPHNPVFRVERDEVYIARLREEAEKFDFELRRLVEQVRQMGAR